MLGAVLGDIIGSCWEGSSCADLPLPLVTPQSRFTDDTVCTIAIADSLLEDTPPDQALRAWARRYPNRGYGGSFYDWVHTEDAPPYNSFANGGAMRVSAVALAAQSEQEALELAAFTAGVTHNHEDGMAGAQAIAVAIRYARTGVEPADIRERLTRRFGYDLRRTVADRASSYGFSTLASETVPDALVAALEATSYEGAIRNAIAIGGDSDTVACMAGGIAEALFGVPEHLFQAAHGKLPLEMWRVLEASYRKAQSPFPLRGTRPQATPTAGGPGAKKLWGWFNRDDR